jgi:hypothetical protein
MLAAEKQRSARGCPENTRYVGIERSGAAARIALKRTVSIDIIHTTAESFDSRGERFDSNRV